MVETGVLQNIGRFVLGESAGLRTSLTLFKMCDLDLLLQTQTLGRYVYT